MNLTDVALDIAAISVLLLISFWLREKISFFRKYFIPVSLIAGILGLILGPQILGNVSPVYIHYSKSIPQWTNFLFCFIFSTSFLGSSSSKFGRDILSTTCVAGAIFMAQVLGGLGIAYGLSQVMSNMPYEIGLLPVAGFYGGHGSAGIIGASFAQEGMNEAIGIAMTYATVGMFAAVIGGMLLINYGAKKGYTKHEMKDEDLDKLTGSALVPAQERKAMANGVSDPSALDPLAFQVMIVGAVIAISYITRVAMIKIFPFWTKIPLYTMCLLMGALVGQFLTKTKYNQYIDRASMKRIAGVTLEYMIVAAVATIKISVLATYFVPMVISSVLLCLLTAWMAIYYSKQWYGEHWFEVAMGLYGQCTGSLATGLLLVKVLDPNSETLASESISGSSTLGSIYQLPTTTMGPMFLLASPLLFVGSYVGLLLLFIVLGMIFFRNKSTASVA